MKFHSLFGILIILFIIYRLIFLERLAFFINKDIPLLRIIIICIITIGCIINIKSTIYHLYNISNTSSLQNIIKKIINILYIKPLINLCNTLIHYKSITIMLNSMTFLIKLIFRGRYTIIFIISSLTFIPRIFLLIMLYWDIFDLSKFCLFYDHINLVFIPMLLTAYIYIMQQHSKTTLDKLNNTVLNIIYDNNTKNYYITPKIKMSETTFKYYETICNNNLYILSLICSIHNLFEKRSFILSNLIILCLYLYCWISCIFLIIL